MKKKRIILIIIVVVLLLLLIPYRKNMLWDGGSIQYKSVLCKYTKVHKLASGSDYYEGIIIEFLGLKIFDNTKRVHTEILYNCDPQLSLKFINDKITEYFADNTKNGSNMAYWHVDEINSKVVVGMIDISNEKQEDFINSVFEICGTDYIKQIKDNQLIEFKESKGVFTGEIIEFKNDYAIVKIIKEEDSHLDSDRVYERGIDTNKYVVGNKVRITYNGMVLTSYPPQIGVSKIELIK